LLKTVADNLIPTMMELGGKNNLIADADLAAAIDGGFSTTARPAPPPPAS